MQPNKKCNLKFNLFILRHSFFALKLAQSSFRLVVNNNLIIIVCFFFVNFKLLKTTLHSLKKTEKTTI